MTVFQDSQDDDEKCIENTGFYAIFLGHTTNVFTQYVTLFKLVYSVDWQHTQTVVFPTASFTLRQP